MDELQNRIKKALKLRKMNQRELAELSGFSAPAINKALARGDFKVSMLQKFAKVLDVPLGYFFSDKNDIDINKSNVQVNIGENNSITSQQMKLEHEIEVLKQKIIGLEKENELLKQMNQLLLKNKQ